MAKDSLTNWDISYFLSTGFWVVFNFWENWNIYPLCLANVAWCVQFCPMARRMEKNFLPFIKLTSIFLVFILLARNESIVWRHMVRYVLCIMNFFDATVNIPPVLKTYGVLGTLITLFMFKWGSKIFVHCASWNIFHSKMYPLWVQKKCVICD